MWRTHIATKIAIGLSLLIMGVICGADALGLVPNEAEIFSRSRTSLCDMFTTQCAAAVARNDTGTLVDLANTIVQRNTELLSVGVRRADGQLVAEAGGHQSIWARAAHDDSIVRAHATISLNSSDWGQVEFCFRPPSSSSIVGLLISPRIRLIIFVSSLTMLATMIMLRRVLQHLDPSAVIPGRVKALLDTLAESVLVLEPDLRIVVANNAFASATGLDTDNLMGQKVSNIPWRDPVTGEIPTSFPWIEAAREGKTSRGVSLTLDSKTAGPRTFSVSAAPIVGVGKRPRGVLVSLDDVTLLHNRNSELAAMISRLEESRAIVHRQNEQLSVLASKDALTGCWNRRAFFERLANTWEDSRRYLYPLSAIMVDVDHFKSVNDNHGHAVGDQVLQRVADALSRTSRAGDVVARYGGEEFCVLLPHTDIEQAQAAGERLREAVMALRVGNLSVTASFGAAERPEAGGSPEALIGSADEALYAAKRTGRNRVVRADRIPKGVEPKATAAAASTGPGARHSRDADKEGDSPSIPFHAVNALMAALQQRDVGTASHSRRVADFCITIASGFLNARDCFLLEIAALLHDVGKIGVPDAILLKPGPLTAEEFEVMDRHTRIGVEIIQSAFKSNELTYIVRTHHAYYAENGRQSALPHGEAIPLLSRILTVADSYDAMVFDRVYRKAMTQEQAFEELRRCAGQQFDPVLVERFIDTLQAQKEHRPARPLSARHERWVQLGLEVEQLASAVDARDIHSVAAIAHHMSEAAAKMELPQIAALALKLHSAAGVERDLSGLLESTNELLAICQAAQKQILAEAA